LSKRALTRITATEEAAALFKHLGAQIRIRRTQEGIGLNAYAEKLGVSPGYLSNLETGKTETITLALLDKLQQELDLISIDNSPEEDYDDFSYRTRLGTEALKDLQKTHPQEAEFLLSIVEQGIKALKK